MTSAPPSRVSWRDAYLWLDLDPEELLRRCRRERFQGSGPGGQKRNRVYSAVRVIHDESGVSAEGAERRESERNLRDALHRLRIAMSLAPRDEAPPWAEKAAGPFRAECNPAHEDFPRALLRALHALAAHGGKIAEASAALGCTGSALTRFLKKDKAGWLRAREIRARQGLPPLR